MSENLSKLIESLSPHERKVIPNLNEKEINNICKKSNLDKVSVIRTLEYLSNKNIIKLSRDKKKIITLGVNGVLYKTKGLPERRLLNLIADKKIISLKDALKQSKLSDAEFKVSLGVLKKKALIELKNKKIFLNANLEEVSKKTLEELFLETLPLELNKLTPEQKFALKSLEKRKEIIEIRQEQILHYELTSLGKQIFNSNLSGNDLIEQVTPEIIKKGIKGKKFRRYDIKSDVPSIYGGKRHFVNQAIDYARKIWIEMGFKEMTGNLVQSSFWNFDALFQPQDHPARDLADTFFINKKGFLPEKKLVDQVKKAHEGDLDKSKGWGYKWEEDIAKQLVLRTHTTCLSAQTLANLKKEDLPAKFFALGKNFRNETVDWSHGFEFYQTEGIVVDKNVNFRHLLGYLTQFYKKMGFEKIRIRPAYFPYTEPSVEIDVWHPEKKTWLELGGAGIFRPEVSISLLGEKIPILAWGQGMDRIIMDYYKIQDLREMYKNNLTKLRNMKFWMKN